MEKGILLHQFLFRRCVETLLPGMIHRHRKTSRKKPAGLFQTSPLGTRSRYRVIAAGIIGPLIHLLQAAEFDIKKEAAWAQSNATSDGTPEQIKYLVNEGCIKPLCDLLVCPGPRIVTVCLEGLESILKVGEPEKNLGATGGVNLYAMRRL